MPVGTAGTVKAMYPDQVQAARRRHLLGNTYHLMLRPGAERVARLGGLHRFMRWPIRSSPTPAASRSCRWRSCARSTRRASPSSRISTARRHVLTPERVDRDPGPARLRHPDAARRMRGAAGRGRRGRAGDAPVAALGRALPHRLRRAARARRCSASCRAATSTRLRSRAPRRARRRSTSRATPSAASRSASRRR